MSEGVIVPHGPSILADAQKRLTESLAFVPPERRGAVVVAATTEGIKAAVVLRADQGFNTWKVETWVEKEWKGGVDYGATVVWTFR